MFIEEIDYGDAKSVPVPSLSALPAASSVPASSPPNKLPSTSPADVHHSTSTADVHPSTSTADVHLSTFTTVEHPSTSPSDEPPSTSVPISLPFRAPANDDNRGAAPPRPRLLNLDDFFIIKASTERKLVGFLCKTFSRPSACTVDLCEIIFLESDQFLYGV